METIVPILMILLFVGKCIYEYRRAEKERVLPPEGGVGGSSYLDREGREGEMFLLGYMAHDMIEGDGDQIPDPRDASYLEPDAF